MTMIAYRKAGVIIPLVLVTLFLACAGNAQQLNQRRTIQFDDNWRFHLGDVQGGQSPNLDDLTWRALSLPHDWSIEGTFDKNNPATPGGGALPGGVGWYRKQFRVPDSDTAGLSFIEFDGVYRNSELWLNGHSLGVRPYGYSSFRYELTPFLHYGETPNLLAVRVDNSRQPNSRWYSGSGIYRNVWMVTTQRVAVDQWGVFITTPDVSSAEARVRVRTTVRNAHAESSPVSVRTEILDERGQSVGSVESSSLAPGASTCVVAQDIDVRAPSLWSDKSPHLYVAVTNVFAAGRASDELRTPFGIRSITFDTAKGFLLNGVQTKIRGVCDHHDLGCLGAAVNLRALERQLEILKAMGANAIRTSHNPPAPELLDLCDRMGFLVMDEAFDMWKQKKTEYDYSLSWDAWHRRDLQDMVLRDRNHPSVILWSIGNEVMEQWDKKDSSGVTIARELSGMIRELDPTRPITAACNDAEPSNPLFSSGILDVIGYNYSPEKYASIPATYPGRPFLATETTSSLATRGHYDMPSDSIRRWPERWDKPFTKGNPDNTCSAYDNCSAPWGSTQEETWKLVKKYPFVSGLFIWTGFDYLGEPTPYDWPSRSSYFGIVDLAGFPKDTYYMYQSEWTDTPVLHLFPHWNWARGQTVDAWVYTNCQEVELFLNGSSLGVKKKAPEDLHLQWRLAFVPGVLRAVGRTAGKEDIVREVRTAGAPAKIVLEADRSRISADGRDLAFVTAKVLDADGTIVPDADAQIRFSISGAGELAGMDSGLETSLEPFTGATHKAYNGLCLAVVRSGGKPGKINLTAAADGLQSASIQIDAR